MGSINNTNVNTFSFGSPAAVAEAVVVVADLAAAAAVVMPAVAAAATIGSLITTQNGITDAHSIGANFRDQWGKNLSVYGSYSFADNTVSTTNNIFQQNTSSTNPNHKTKTVLKKIKT